MHITDICNIIGAVITLGLGLMGLIRPSAAASFTSMQPVGEIGVSESRATYGGFFLMIGVYCLYSSEETAFILAGAAWMGAAGGRFLSFFIDNSRSPKNLGGILFEGIIGALLLV